MSPGMAVLKTDNCAVNKDTSDSRFLVGGLEGCTLLI